MKIKFMREVEMEQEIEVPYYFTDIVGNICKHYEDYLIRIRCDNFLSQIEIKKELMQENFEERSLYRFLDKQKELSDIFQEKLSEIITKITK
jgi:hypothetical protein